MNYPIRLYPATGTTGLTLSNQPTLCWCCAQKVSVVVVSQDPQHSRQWGWNLNESIILDQFDQFCAGRGAGSHLWWQLPLATADTFLTSISLTCDKMTLTIYTNTWNYTKWHVSMFVCPVLLSHHLEAYSLFQRG